MAYYGGSGVEIQYIYVAVFPFQAEHPIGSGNIVSYNPGDEFPGEDWGNAAHNLVEVGKAVRLATNVGGGDPPVAAPPAPSTERTAQEVNGDHAPFVEVTSYPQHEGAGWFTLSDGERVRGKEAAFAAQEQLDRDA